MRAKPHHRPLGPESTIRDLAASTLLDVLNKAELVVYVRLLVATHEQKSREVVVFNSALHTNPRTAASALRSLEEQGLIATAFSREGRTVEVR